jgi:hypothetical protein
MQCARYTFRITADARTFSATANANLDDDAALDTWTIDQDGNLVNTSDDATS